MFRIYEVKLLFDKILFGLELLTIEFSCNTFNVFDFSCSNNIVFN
jgi:hypothetical protein